MTRYCQLRFKKYPRELEVLERPETAFLYTTIEAYLSALHLNRQLTHEELQGIEECNMKGAHYKCWHDTLSRQRFRQPESIKKK